MLFCMPNTPVWGPSHLWLDFAIQVRLWSGILGGVQFMGLTDRPLAIILYLRYILASKRDPLQ